MARGNRIISKTQDQASGRESEDRPVKAAHTHTHKARPARKKERTEIFTVQSKRTNAL